MPTKDMTPAEAQAWRELEEAEQALERARWRYIEASNRASRPRHRRLRLVEAPAEHLDQSCA